MMDLDRGGQDSSFKGVKHPLEGEHGRCIVANARLAAMRKGIAFKDRANESIIGIVVRSGQNRHEVKGTTIEFLGSHLVGEPSSSLSGNKRSTSVAREKKTFCLRKRGKHQLLNGESEIYSAWHDNCQRLRGLDSAVGHDCCNIANPIPNHIFANYNTELSYSR